MTFSRKILIGAATGTLVLGSLTAAFAQPPGPPPSPDFSAQPGQPGQRPGKAKAARQQRQAAQPGQPNAGDPARRAERLRTQLAITPAQEGAFNAYIQATQAPGGPPPQGMTTPQRLDMQLAELTARVNATKRLYTQLTPEQRQTFDSLPPQMTMNGPGGARGPGGRNTLQNPAPNGGYNPQ